jgi:hypothetical protein
MRYGIVWLALAAVGAPALGDGGGDIGFSIIEGRLVTGLADDVEGTVIPGPRVFGADFVEFGGEPYSDEPGLFALQGEFPESELGFDFAGAVLAWDGASFDPGNIAASAITMRFGPAEATSPAEHVVHPGFAIPVGPNGFDEHFDISLGEPAGDGVYLLALNFWSDDPGIAPAKTAWIVFNWNRDEAEHEEAIHWVEENLVPAPGMAMLAMGGAALIARRRR